MGQIIHTRLGDFTTNRKVAVGISVYRAGRSICSQRMQIKVGECFAITHRFQYMLRKPPVLRLYGGEFIGRFTVDGTEVRIPGEGEKWLYFLRTKAGHVDSKRMKEYISFAEQHNCEMFVSDGFITFRIVLPESKR